jgi:hypothetical protein
VDFGVPPATHSSGSVLATRQSGARRRSRCSRAFRAATAGVRGRLDRGRLRVDPGRQTRCLAPELLTTFGSGKFGTPWLRMHIANPSPRWRACADRASVVSLYGKYFWQCIRSARNAAALTEMPLTEMVCVAVDHHALTARSEKFGTKLARVHLENTSVELVEYAPALVKAPEAELFGVADEPQAATAMPQETATKSRLRT